MNNFILSIVIPHYNSPQSLGKLLDSIIDEVENGVEVIVVDDKSDRFLAEYEVCKNKYKSYGVSFLVNDTGIKGAGSSRNVGVENATGKWLLFADADDYYLENWFEVVSEYFDTEYDVVYFVPSSINLGTGKSGTRELPYTKRIINYLNGVKEGETVLRYEFNVPWSKLIRRELIDRHGIRFDCTRNGDDAMFSTKVGYFLNSLHADNRVIYCVTEGENTLSTTISDNDFYIRTEVMVNKYKYLHERLSKEEWDLLSLKSEPIKRLYKVIKRHYGFKSFLKYYKLFKFNNIPIVTISALRDIIVK